MDRQLSLIRDITPATPQRWTCKVMITEKSAPREARSTPTKYQKLVLTDSTGGVIEAIIFNTQINMFKDRLELFKKYYISNAVVQEAKHNYRFGSTNYQWILNNSCLIDEVEGDDENAVGPQYNFLHFDDLFRYKDSPTPVDLLVVVLQMIPKKPIKIKNGPLELQEFVVIDKSLKPVIMTFWDPFVKNEAVDLATIIDQKPILAAMRVNVVPYDGITINTRGKSFFLINPTIPAAVDLRTWLYDNMQSVNALLNSEDLVDNARAFGKEATNALTTVSAIAKHPHLRLLNVKCTLKLTNLKQSYIIMSCSACNQKTSAAYNTSFTCNHCGKSGVISTPRLRAEVDVHDSTGTVAATLLGPEAEKFLGCSVDVVYQNSLKAIPLPIETMIKAESAEEVYVQLRVYTNQYHGAPVRKLGASFIEAPATIVKIEPSKTENASSTHLTVVDVEQTINEADDLDLTPEEKKLLENILMRKKRKHIQASSSSSFSIDNAIADSPFTTAFEVATNESASLEQMSPDLDTHTISESEALNASGKLDDEDNWDELMKGPPAEKKTEAKVTALKAKRKLHV